MPLPSPAPLELASKGPRRLPSVDALRGLAVFLMMEQHMGVWLYGGTTLSPPLIAFNALGGAAAPLFITLAGAGTSLSLLRRGVGDRVLLRRGLVLLGFGYLLSLLTPSWFTLRSWFVLHMMGVAIASAPLWRRLSSRGLLVVAGLVIAVTPLLQGWLGTPRYLFNDRMALRPPFAELPGGHLRVALVEGQFPIFPWLSMFLVGMVVGRILGRRDAQDNGLDNGEDTTNRRDLHRLTLAFLGLGGLLALAGTLGGSIDALGFLREPAWRRVVGLPLGFFPATAAIILLLQAVVLGLLVVATALAARLPQHPHEGPRGPLVALGRISLTLLLVHVVVFREFSRPVGLWQALDAATTLGVIGLWTLLCLAIARAWQKIGYRYGAEWLLRRLAG